MNLHTVIVAPTASIVVMNRNGEVAVLDAEGREREKYPVIYGATMQGCRRAGGGGRAAAGRMGPVHHAHPYGGSRVS